MTRYLITVDGSGAKMQPMDVTGKSLVDAQAARNLVRDMNQTVTVMCRDLIKGLIDFMREKNLVEEQGFFIRSCD